MSFKTFFKDLINRSRVKNQLLIRNKRTTVLLPRIRLIETMMTMSKSEYHFDPQVLSERKSDYPIHPMILSRSSPREMTGEEVSDADLMRLLEAGRWAPSHYNLQPWRFVYAKRKTKHFDQFLELLWPLNREWAQKSAVLLVIISNKYYKYNDQKDRDPDPQLRRRQRLDFDGDGRLCHRFCSPRDGRLRLR